MDADSFPPLEIQWLHLRCLFTAFSPGNPLVVPEMLVHRKAEH